MRNTKNAFTLVELIVVITILAILGTIAFISLQGYSADARNSKRTSDVGNIQSAISLKMVEGVPLLSFIETDAASKVSPLSIAGSGTYTGTDYDAGTPNYTVLNVIEKDFKDPKSDKEYRIGATGLAGGVFQVAATMEQDGTDTALVNGTYNARTTAKGNNSASGTADGTTFTLADADANTFKVSDSIALTGGTGLTVTVAKVSRDGVTLTLSASAGTNNSAALSVAESDGLIDAALDATGAVENLDTATTGSLPY